MSYNPLFDQFLTKLTPPKHLFSLTRLSKKQVVIVLFVIISLLNIVTPVSAHHAIEGKVPSNWLEGLISGFAHPIIGVDHFLGVIAIALIGVAQPWGLFLPISFIIATLGGSGLHLLTMDLPFSEIIIALSVIVFGLILTFKQYITQGVQFTQVIGLLLGAIAGIFHGYAYGESIIGAQMSPLFAYLIGFTTIQLIIALSTYKIGTIIFEQWQSQFWKIITFMGLSITTGGLVFLFS